MDSSSPYPEVGRFPPLSVRELTVRYGALTAVDRLSFTVAPGEIYGLLGSNGAGKSSTIKSIVGLVPPQGGTVRVFGEDAGGEGLRSKELIGYVPESALVFDALTPREFLEFVASVRRIPPDLATSRAIAYLRAFQIEPEFEQPIATLSNGTRQKVLLLAAFLHQPPLLVLDEPLNNLDPRSVRIVKELLTQYVADGRRGVLFSTHTMEVAERLCHRIGILDRGVLKGEGTMASFRAQAASGDATLEEIFLHLTSEEEGVREAVRSLGRA
jgi:ABC-2 type transport system ATP-binding protein